MATQPSKKRCKRFYIERVEISNKFATNSDKFGFDEEVQDSYDDDLLDLQERWQQDGFIEIYDETIHGTKAFYPLAKDSNSVPGSSPEYTGLYHARLLSTGENDPLVIVTFQGVIIDQRQYEKAVIEAMIDHDLMFLPHKRKNPADLKSQRKWVRNKLDQDDSSPH
ncbi:hypothetical protein AAIB78_002370 [Morganella morganii]